MKPTAGRPKNKGGRPKGSRSIETLDKIAAREALRLMVTAKMQPLVDAQIANALGIAHLFIRDKAGKFVQVTDPAQIQTILNSGKQNEYFYVHTKDPSIQAFTDLMNRALDKPAEQIKLTGAEDGPVEVRFRWQQ